MYEPYPPDEAPATPEYVFSVLLDQHEQSRWSRDVDDARLTVDTTLAEWWIDDFYWDALVAELHRQWRLRARTGAFRQALTPLTERTVADACRFMATHATRPTIRPLDITGAPDRVAVAFLTIQTLLAENGATPAIAPSTPLHRHLRPNTPEWFELTRLAPGALPRVHDPLDTIETACVGVAVTAFLLIVASPFLTFATSLRAGSIAFALGAAALLGAWLVAWLARRFFPFPLDFGELRTFRDLAERIANHDADDDRSFLPAG